MIHCQSYRTLLCFSPRPHAIYTWYSTCNSIADPYELQTLFSWCFELEIALNLIYTSPSLSEPGWPHSHGRPLDI